MKNRNMRLILAGLAGRTLLYCYRPFLYRERKISTEKTESTEKHRYGRFTSQHFKPHCYN